MNAIFSSAAAKPDASARPKEGLKSSPIYATLPDYSKAGRVRASTGVAFQWQSPMDHWYSLMRNQSKKYENDDVEQFQFSNWWFFS